MTLDRNLLLSQIEKINGKPTFYLSQSNFNKFLGIDPNIFFYCLGVNLILFFCAPVAQRIRASDYGSEGREFESLQARLKICKSLYKQKIRESFPSLD